MALTKERKKKIISDHKVHKKDSGSPEVQVAVLTERINDLTKHFEKNAKDHHSRRGLITMVNQRKRLLAHLQKEEPQRYKALITRLELRK